jgi:hypothetical protein
MARSTVAKGGSVLTVRVSKAVREKLDAESKMSGITLNTLISQIITKHTEWDRFAKDVGLVKTGSSTEIPLAAL